RVFLRAPPRRIAWAAAAACLTAIAVVLPFAVAGTLVDVRRAVARMAAAYPYWHVEADNLWLVFAGGRHARSSVPPLYDFDRFLGLTYRNLGVLAFGLLYLVVLHALLGRSRAKSWVAGGAVVALGFFVLNTRMHENYVFLTFPLLSALAASPA